MGEILGLGVTHYPPLIAPDEDRLFPLRRTLARDDRVPSEMKDPRNWPQPMREEYGEDEGFTSAIRHRQRLVDSFRKVRAELDAFNPDFVLIWGDDQYENFREDIIPPFCLLAYAEAECQPFLLPDGSPRRNIWNEAPETVFTYQGFPSASRYLVSQLIDNGIDMAYAYKPLHHPGLAHAFVNTLLYLDYDRQGFNYPVLPITVNCYGSRVIRNRGGALPNKVNGRELDADPPGPTPKRCMEVGAVTAKILQDSPWRVALVASSSWSHAFLTKKHHWLWPDIESDRKRFEELKAGDYASWRQVSTSEIEDAGQQELLNWMCLAGAMEALERQVEIVDYIETYVFNSSKCMAIFRP
ncbi:MAG: extradiol ring-cleavage dioxygenase [bacterium]|nr:extradiol ring-cleavage dioxygenase [bacterium]